MFRGSDISHSQLFGLLGEGRGRGRGREEEEEEEDEEEEDWHFDLLAVRRRDGEEEEEEDEEDRPFGSLGIGGGREEVFTNRIRSTVHSDAADEVGHSGVLVILNGRDGTFTPH